MKALIKCSLLAILFAITFTACKKTGNGVVATYTTTSLPAVGAGEIYLLGDPGDAASAGPAAYSPGGYPPFINVSQNGYTVLPFSNFNFGHGIAGSDHQDAAHRSYNDAVQFYLTQTGYTPMQAGVRVVIKMGWTQNAQYPNENMMQTVIQYYFVR